MIARARAAMRARAGAPAKARATARTSAKTPTKSSASTRPRASAETGAAIRPGRPGRRWRHWRRRLPLIAALLAAVAPLAGGWLWLRDSSLVSVRHVKVTGVSGPDGPQIQTALISAAHSMTTLDVNTARLRTAVAPFPVVKDLHVSTQFPHGMQIDVVEEVPVAAVVVGGHSIPVSGDGTLLPDVKQLALPAIPLSTVPGGNRVTNGGALEALKLLAAAPSGWLARISQVTTNGPQGITAQIRGGPVIYFGDSSRARAKWLALAAVLADPGSAGAAYIDVTDPERPAAGSGTDTNAAGSQQSSGSSGNLGATNQVAPTTTATATATAAATTATATATATAAATTTATATAAATTTTAAAATTTTPTTPVAPTDTTASSQ